MTIYSEKIDEFINQLENEMIEINQDIRKLYFNFKEMIL